MASNQSPPPDYEPSRWDPLVIGLVAGICTVFLLLSYYKILRRHCCTSQGILQFSLNRNQRHRLSEGNHDDLSLQFQSRGLDSFLMHSLPITQFKEKDKKNDDDEEEEEEEEEEEKQGNNTDCAVCLGEFEEGDWIKHLPNCSHIFHVSCIDLWFQAHSSCPLCRSLVYRLTVNPECSVSVDSLLETLRRDDFNRERSSHYQVLRTHILQNTLPRMERDSDSSV